jgi:hypothetical protein
MERLAWRNHSRISIYHAAQYIAHYHSQKKLTAIGGC